MEGNNAAPAPVDNTPAPTDAQAPVDNQPADPNQAPESTGQPDPQPNNHIQPGQSPTDLDMEALLDDLEAENQAEAEAEAQKKAEEEAAKPPEGEPKPGDQEQPKEGEQPKDQQSSDPYEQVDYRDPANLLSPPEDAHYGIAPLGEIRNPQQGESAQEYFNSVTAPAIVQLVQNLSGIATRNVDRVSAQQEESQTQKYGAWKQQIDNLVKSGDMPAYDVVEGKMNPDSEGGKHVAEVIKLVNEYNQKQENPDLQIQSFEVGHQLLMAKKAREDKSKAAQDANSSRRNRAALLSGNSNGGGAKQKGGPQHIKKGQSVTDLDFESLLS